MVLASSWLYAQPSAIDEYFKQYIDDDRFTVVYIGAKLIGLFDKIDIGDSHEMNGKEVKSFKKMAGGLKGLRILTAEENADNFYKEAKDKLNTTDYEILMTVRDNDGSNFDFFIKETDEGKVSELLLLAGGSGEDFVLMSFIGSLNIEDITNFAKDVGN